MNQNYFDISKLVRLVRLAEVIHSTGRSRSSIYSDIKEGVFPKPVKIGKRSVAWSSEDISNWIANRISGGDQ
jgi:prophage regulatory protein